MDQGPQPMPRKNNPKPRSPAPILTKRNGAKSPAGLMPALAGEGHTSEARSRQMLAAMMAFSGGDFGARLPVDWSGADGRIAEAFNQTIGNAQRITDEAARLSTTVGKEGRLSWPQGAGGGRRCAQHLRAHLGAGKP